MRAKLVIVGGGPAGLATAICAAQRGLSAVVVDKRGLPLDKPCGEGLMPGGVAALAGMGVEIAADERAPFVGIRYVDGDVVAEGRFADGPGWGIRRTTLIEAMVARAQALGVELHYGCTAGGWHRTAGGVLLQTAAGSIAASVLVGADGLHSRVRRDTGLGVRWRGPQRFGMRRHFPVQPWSPFVEVYWGDAVEAYVTPVGPHRIGVAFLWSGRHRTFDDLLKCFPTVHARLSAAIPETEPRGAGPFRQGVRQRYGEGVVLIGDAAGYLDAITGEGLTLAFRSARALAETIACGHPLRAYDRAYRRLSRSYYHLTTVLLALASRPRLRRLAFQSLARWPGLFDRLLAVHTGERPLSSLGATTPPRRGSSRGAERHPWQA
jgi:flavin-dependent dehydrogenase